MYKTHVITVQLSISQIRNWATEKLTLSLNGNIKKKLRPSHSRSSSLPIYIMWPSNVFHSHTNPIGSLIIWKKYLTLSSSMVNLYFSLINSFHIYLSSTYYEPENSRHQSTSVNKTDEKQGWDGRYWAESPCIKMTGILTGSIITICWNLSSFPISISNATTSMKPSLIHY